MDGTWDLSILYQGFDDPKYAADLEKLEQSVDTFCRRIDAIAASQERMSAGQLAELLKMQEEIIVLRDDLQKYAVLRRETNAGEEAAANIMDWLQKYIAWRRELIRCFAAGLEK